MLEFAYPWAFAAFLLPPLVTLLLPVYRESKDSVQVPFFQRLVELTGLTPSKGAVVLQRLKFQRIWVALCWVLLVLALAKPEWVGDVIVHEKSARDLMVAVDLSGSMETRDFVDASGTTISRLEAVKQVLAEFVQQRQRDRLGLIVFGSAAFIQAPFTEDHKAWTVLLNETDIGMAGPSTLFGDAIGLALKTFEHSETENRVLIVLTDGNDTGSKVPPVEAAKVAASRGVTIYSIAIGDPETVGEEALDVEAMTAIAELTGGAYYQALNRQELAEIYRRIAELEPELYETLSYRPRYTLHYYPLMVIAAVYSLFFTIMAVGLWRSRRGQTHV